MVPLAIFGIILLFAAGAKAEKVIEKKGEEIIERERAPLSPLEAVTAAAAAQAKAAQAQAAKTAAALSKAAAPALAEKIVDLNLEELSGGRLKGTLRLKIDSKGNIFQFLDIRVGTRKIPAWQKIIWNRPVAILPKHYPQRDKLVAAIARVNAARAAGKTDDLTAAERALTGAGPASIGGTLTTEAVPARSEWYNLSPEEIKARQWEPANMALIEQWLLPPPSGKAALIKGIIGIAAQVGLSFVPGVGPILATMSKGILSGEVPRRYRLDR
jgi:hypothetical protein